MNSTTLPPLKPRNNKLYTTAGGVTGTGSINNVVNMNSHTNSNSNLNATIATTGIRATNNSHNHNNSNNNNNNNSSSGAMALNGAVAANAGRHSTGSGIQVQQLYDNSTTLPLNSASGAGNFKYIFIYFNNLFLKRTFSKNKFISI
jgi:hypothetical protein